MSRVSRADGTVRDDGVLAARLAIDVIELLARHRDIGVTEIARQTGTTKPRAFRHLRTLVACGYAVQDESSERYSAGPRLLGFASRLLAALGTLLVALIACALPGLFYQNTGYMQFGFRFSLDYTPFLVMLLAVGGWSFRALPVQVALAGSCPVTNVCEPASMGKITDTRVATTAVTTRVDMGILPWGRLHRSTIGVR